MLLPVSYTHLDVYKRQRLHLASLRELREPEENRKNTLNTLTGIDHYFLEYWIIKCGGRRKGWHDAEKEIRYYWQEYTNINSEYVISTNKEKHIEGRGCAAI